MRFKVVGGSHEEGGKTYSKGAIIKTDKDLVKMFGAKFERLHDNEDTPPAPPVIPTPLSKEKKVEVQTPLEADESGEKPNLSESQAVTNIEPEVKKTKKKVVRRKVK